MITIVDYDAGNLKSVEKALDFLGEKPVITREKKEILKADKVILPGVGAFEDAIAKLRATGLVDTVIEQTEKGKPLLGICLGMQLLFEESHEYGVHKGLGLVKGTIASIDEDLAAAGIEGLKVPHIGWNALTFREDEPLFKYIKEGDCVYYVHSFYGKECDESTIASSEYGIRITGAVRNGNVYGTQFHPEKSGEVGLNILRAFLEV